jgi:hypothetical protein
MLQSIFPFLGVALHIIIYFNFLHEPKCVLVTSQSRACLKARPTLGKRGASQSRACLKARPTLGKRVVFNNKIVTLEATYLYWRDFEICSLVVL